MTTTTKTGPKSTKKSTTKTNAQKVAELHALERTKATEKAEKAEFKARLKAQGQAIEIAAQKALAAARAPGGALARGPKPSAKAPTSPVTVVKATKGPKGEKIPSKPLAKAEVSSTRTPKRIDVIVACLSRKHGATLEQIAEALVAAYPRFSERHGGGKATAEGYMSFARAAVSHLKAGRQFTIAAETKGKIKVDAEGRFVWMRAS